MAMKRTEKQNYPYHKGKFLIFLGFLFLLAGVLRVYGVSLEWVLIVIGIILVLKGLWIKTRS